MTVRYYRQLVNNTKNTKNTKNTNILVPFGYAKTTMLYGEVVL